MFWVLQISPPRSPIQNRCRVQLIALADSGVKQPTNPAPRDFTAPSTVGSPVFETTPPAHVSLRSRGRRREAPRGEEAGDESRRSGRDAKPRLIAAFLRYALPAP